MEIPSVIPAWAPWGTAAAKESIESVKNALQHEIKVRPHHIQLITIVHNLLWAYTVILYVLKCWQMTGKRLEITSKSSENIKNV